MIGIPTLFPKACTLPCKSMTRNICLKVMLIISKIRNKETQHVVNHGAI